MDTPITIFPNRMAGQQAVQLQSAVLQRATATRVKQRGEASTLPLERADTRSLAIIGTRGSCSGQGRRRSCRLVGRIRH